MNVEIGKRGRAVSFMGIHKSDFLCSVHKNAHEYCLLNAGNKTHNRGPKRPLISFNKLELANKKATTSILSLENR